MLMANTPLDILAINETRLDESINDNAVALPGYNIIRNDRNRQGGGAPMYLKENIAFVEKKDLRCVYLESLTIEVSAKFIQPFCVSTWYRPPGSDLDLFDKFDELLAKLDNVNKESLILGDFNCNLLEAKANLHAT